MIINITYIELNQFVLLEYMRSSGEVVCLNDLVDHDQFGGITKRKALEHVLKRLYSHQLIERVDVPLRRGKGRPPAFYKATGIISKRPFNLSLARGVSLSDAGLIENPFAGTDNKFLRVRKNPSVGKIDEGSTPFSDETIFPEDVGIKKPYSAREELKPTDSDDIRVDERLNLDCPFD